MLNLPTPLPLGCLDTDLSDSYGCIFHRVQLEDWATPFGIPVARPAQSSDPGPEILKNT